MTVLWVTLHVGNLGIGDAIIKAKPKQTAEMDMHITNLIKPKIRKLLKR